MGCLVHVEHWWKTGYAYSILVGKPMERTSLRLRALMRDNMQKL
jgi:hypothetical protein